MWLIAALTALTLTLRHRLRHRPTARPTALVLAALLAAALAASIAQTVVIAVLPAFARELSAPATTVTWVLTAFMLSSAVATPIAGRLGDLFGYRAVLIACLACFAVGSLVCALAAHAHSLAALITGRALQGIAGGVFPLAFGIARTYLPPARLPGTVALLSAMFGIGGAAGMVAAGPLVDALGTPWLFWGTLALAAAALAAASALPATRPPGTGRLDLGGAALLSAALVCLLLAISQGRHWAAIIALFTAAAIGLAAFAVLESRTSTPLVDLRLLRTRAQAATNLATFIVGVAMFGGITLVPQYVQTPAATGYGFGLSPSGVGLIMLPVAAAMLIASPATARLARRHGARLPLQAGTICASAALAFLAVTHDQLADFYLTGLLLGTGYGLAFAAIGILIVQTAPVDRTGVATGINTVVRTIGGAVSAQIAAASLATRTPASHTVPDETGYTLAFTCFAALAITALATGAAIGTLREAGRTDSGPAD